MTPQRTNTAAALASGLVRLNAAALLLRFARDVVGLVGAPEDRVLLTATRGLGLRDAALGGLAVRAALRGDSAPDQIRLQGAADVGDALLLGYATRSGRLPTLRGSGAALFAVASAVAHFAIAARVSSRSVPRKRGVMPLHHDAVTGS